MHACILLHTMHEAEHRNCSNSRSSSSMVGLSLETRRCSISHCVSYFIFRDVQTSEQAGSQHCGRNQFEHRPHKQALYMSSILSSILSYTGFLLKKQCCQCVPFVCSSSQRDIFLVWSVFFSVCFFFRFCFHSLISACSCENESIVRCLHSVCRRIWRKSGRNYQDKESKNDNI